MSGRRRFAIGDRVKLLSTGAAGVVILSPGRAFNGWTVRLDEGRFVGADDRQMRRASRGPGDA